MLSRLGIGMELRGQHCCIQMTHCYLLRNEEEMKVTLRVQSSAAESGLWKCGEVWCYTYEEKGFKTLYVNGKRIDGK